MQTRIIYEGIFLLGDLQYQEDMDFHGRDTLIQLILPLTVSYSTQRINMMNAFMDVHSAYISSLKLHRF